MVHVQQARGAARAYLAPVPLTRVSVSCSRCGLSRSTMLLKQVAQVVGNATSLRLLAASCFSMCWLSQGHRAIHTVAAEPCLQCVWVPDISVRGGPFKWRARRGHQSSRLLGLSLHRHFIVHVKAGQQAAARARAGTEGGRVVHAGRPCMEGKRMETIQLVYSLDFRLHRPFLAQAEPGSKLPLGRVLALKEAGQNNTRLPSRRGHPF